MKDGRVGHCKTCHASYCKKHHNDNKAHANKASAAYRENNKERQSELMSKWQKANPDRCSANSAKWRKANKAQAAKAARIYREAHKEEIAVKQKLHHAKNKDAITIKSSAWKKANKGRVNTSTAKRRATQLQATPIWADLKAIEEIYKLSSAVTELMEPTHVDHIVPLRGKYVCGLHVEYNLQLLRAEDNVRKGNKYYG
jgi:hypothetical protein